MRLRACSGARALGLLCVLLFRTGVCDAAPPRPRRVCLCALEPACANASPRRLQFALLVQVHQFQKLDGNGEPALDRCDISVVHCERIGAPALRAMAMAALSSPTLSAPRQC